VSGGGGGGGGGGGDSYRPAKMIDRCLRNWASNLIL